VTQLLNFLGKQTVDDQLKSLTDRDVLIAPDLGEVSAVKFDRSKDAIRIGEEATRALADKLRRYSLPPEQYAALRARQVAQAKSSARSTKSASRDWPRRIRQSCAS
jgi:NTE family protein